MTGRLPTIDTAAVLAAARQSLEDADRALAEADRAMPKLACPSCGHQYSKVRNSRGVGSDGVVRRRRECTNCGARYSTAERVIVGSLARKSA